MMMDIWEIGEIEQFKVVQNQQGIMLYRANSNQIDQETYFAIERKKELWSTYIVQRAKRTIRYVTPTYEFAQIGACVLFHKHFMYRQEAYNWSDIDTMIKETNIIEAIQAIRKELPICADNKKDEHIVLQQCGNSIDVMYCCTNDHTILTTSSDYHQALRAYRNYNLMLVRFQRIFSNFMRYIPTVDSEYNCFIKMFLK